MTFLRRVACFFGFHDWFLVDNSFDECRRCDVWRLGPPGQMQ